jgi:hypothetical protein
MSDATPYKPSQWRKNRGSKVSITGLPSQEELDQQTPEQAERYPLYTREQIEAETRDVKLCITFGRGTDDPASVIKIRDQAELIMAGMRSIIETTRKHDSGSVNQRIEARAIAASLGRVLTRFNGRTPYGDWKPKKRST